MPHNNTSETKKEPVPQQQQQRQQPTSRAEGRRSASHTSRDVPAPNGGLITNQHQHHQHQHQQHHHHSNTQANSSSSGVSSGPKHRKSKTQEMVEKKSTRWFRVMTTLHSYPVEGPHYLLTTNEEWYCDNTKCKHTTYGKYAKYPLACWRSVELGAGFVLCDPCVKLYSAARNARIASPNAVKPVHVNITLEVNPNITNNGHPTITPHITSVMYDKPLDANTVAPAINVVTTYVNDNQQYQDEGKQAETGGVIKEEEKIKEIPKETPKEIPKEIPREAPKEVPKEIPAEISKAKDARVLKQGWLLKQGEMIKSWKQRYFMLQSDGLLYYYQDDKSNYPLGVVDLKTCRKIRCGSSMDFDLITDERTWKFVAKKSDTRDDWVAHICELSECVVENDANPFDSIGK